MTDIKTIEGTFTSGKGNYSIVVGRWNSFVVEPLLQGALDTLRRHGVSDKQITIVRAPGSEKSANGGVEWSCSSCFLYAVRGRTEGAPPLVEGPALHSALKKLAKHHKKTQMPSEVP